MFARTAALALRAFPEPSRKCKPTGWKSLALVQVETGMEVACELPKGVRRSVVEPDGDPGLLASGSSPEKRAGGSPRAGQ